MNRGSLFVISHSCCHALDIIKNSVKKRPISRIHDASTFRGYHLSWRDILADAKKRIVEYSNVTPDSDTSTSNSARDICRKRVSTEMQAHRPNMQQNMRHRRNFCKKTGETSSNIEETSHLQKSRTFRLKLKMEPRFQS